MTRTLLLSSLMVLTICSFGQMTSINSDADVERLIRSLDKKSDFKIKYDTSEESKTRWFWFTKSGICDTVNTQPWLKVDLDNNGLADLLVRGFEDGRFVTKIVFNNKDDKPNLRDFSRSFWFPCSAFRPITLNDTKLLEYINYYRERNKTGQSELKIWTRQLIFKFGSLIEYNESPKKHAVTSVTYAANGCFGECPIFTISIEKDRSAVFKAGRYNKKEGDFKSNLRVADYSEIIDLLNYIDFTKLNDEYPTKVSDGPSCELTIKTENGETKVVKDATMQGTLGLARLYEIFDNLRTNQRWIKTAHNKMHVP